jgi:hypothetical protein
MKRLALICCLALGTAIGGTAASAAPATTAVGGLKTQSGIELAQYKRRGNYNRHRGYGNRGYRRGRYYGGNRYRGWHRYNSRPYGWRSRGCVIVGPVWVCP